MIPRLLFALGLLLLLGATVTCGGEDPRVSVDITPSAIDADGRATARVTVSLEDYDGVVLLSTSRGTFQDSGAERTVIQAVAGQAVGVLVACDEALDLDCPGNASVVATADTEIGYGVVALLSIGAGADGGASD